MLSSEANSLIRYTQKLFQDFPKDHIQVSEAEVRFIHGSSQVSDKICEIYLKLNDKNIFVVQQAVSFETSAVKAVNKLKLQLDKIAGDKLKSGMNF